MCNSYSPKHWLPIVAPLPVVAFSLDCWEGVRAVHGVCVWRGGGGVGLTVTHLLDAARAALSCSRSCAERLQFRQAWPGKGLNKNDQVYTRVCVCKPPVRIEYFVTYSTAGVERMSV